MAEKITVLSPEAKRELLKKEINKGLFVNLEHLQGIERLSYDLSQDTGEYLVFRTLSEICLRLSCYWEENPLTVEDAQRIDLAMRDKMVKLVDTLDDPCRSVETMESLTELVLAYDQCLGHLRNTPI